MSEWHLFLKIFKSPKSDVIVLLTTFLLTVFVDLTVAIKLGVVIAALLFMKRMSEATEVGCITDSLADQETDEEDFVDQNRISQKDIPEDVEVFEINGTRIILSGLQPRPFKKIKRAGLLKNTEDKNIQPTIDHAIDRAWQILKESKQNGIDD